jgi:general secretion pathway protein L
MARPVLVRLGRDVAAGSSWACAEIEESGRACWHEEALAALRQRARGRRLHLLVPGTDVLLTRVQLPRMGRRRRARAIPYALEEELATEVEELHFAAGSPVAEGLPVAVVARAAVLRWLEDLAAAGLEPHALTPEVLAVPWAPGAWSVLVDGARVLVRQSAQAGFVSEVDALEAFLGAALYDAADDAPHSIHYYAGTDDDSAGRVAAVIEHAGLNLIPHAERARGGAWLGEGYDPDAAIDLLQGDFARAATPGARSRRWASATAMLVAATLIQLGVSYLEVRRLGATDRELEARGAALLREAYPDAPETHDPLAALAARAAGAAPAKAAATDGFLHLLERGAGPLGTLEGWEIGALDYRDGHLDLELQVRDAQSLDTLARTLAAAGRLRVEVLSATASEGAAVGRLRLRDSEDAAP